MEERSPSSEDRAHADSGEGAGDTAAPAAGGALRELFSVSEDMRDWWRNASPLIIPDRVGPIGSVLEGWANRIEAAISALRHAPPAPERSERWWQDKAEREEGATVGAGGPPAPLSSVSRMQSDWRSQGPAFAPAAPPAPAPSAAPTLYHVLRDDKPAWLAVWANDPASAKHRAARFLWCDPSCISLRTDAPVSPVTILRDPEPDEAPALASCPEVADLKEILRMLVREELSGLLVEALDRLCPKPDPAPEEHIAPDTSSTLRRS